MGYRESYFEKYKSKRGYYKCAQCGQKLKKEDAHIDHIFPQCKGGSNNTWNLQLLCRTCNCSKNDIIDCRVILGYFHKIFSKLKNSMSNKKNK